MKKEYRINSHWVFRPAILIRNLCYLLITLLIFWPVVSYLDYLFHINNPIYCASWNFWLWLI